MLQKLPSPLSQLVDVTMLGTTLSLHIKNVWLKVLLKQSGQAWYKYLSAAMNKIGFTKSRSDAAVFYRHDGKGFVIIAMAMDNLTITTTNDNIIHEIKEIIESETYSIQGKRELLLYPLEIRLLIYRIFYSGSKNHFNVSWSQYNSIITWEIK